MSKQSVLSETIKKSTHCTFLALKTIFDTVDHKQFLENKTQITYLSKRKSSLKKTCYGVPQSSDLGPIFFIIFINDSSSGQQTTHTFLYADDTAILTSELNGSLAQEHQTPLNETEQ